MTWIQTGVHRKEFDFAKPAPSMVHIEDVAQALSRIPRFNGHTTQAYTVGEHSIRVGMRALYWARSDGHPEETVIEIARCALLHDAAEAYTGDIVNPLKQILKKAFVPGSDPFTTTELIVDEALLGDISEPLREHYTKTYVKPLDLSILGLESAVLLRGGRTRDWPLLAGVPDPAPFHEDFTFGQRLCSNENNPGRDFLAFYRWLTGEQLLLPWYFHREYRQGRVARIEFNNGGRTAWRKISSSGSGPIALSLLDLDETRLGTTAYGWDIVTRVDFDGQVP